MRFAYANFLFDLINLAPIGILDGTHVLPLVRTVLAPAAQRPHPPRGVPRSSPSSRSPPPPHFVANVIVAAHVPQEQL